jgi:D-alanyl-D-alanine endopeptidase (penicillin-binding protein 7)
MFLSYTVRDELERRMTSWKLFLGALSCALTLSLGLPPAAEAASAKSSASSGKKSRAKSVRKAKPRKVVHVVPARPSNGQLAGLRATDDPLDLKSSVALVIDQETDEVLFSKNSDAVLPIASITKLMTAMVVLQAEQPMDEVLQVSQADVDTEKGSRSRLAVGTRLTRGEMLHLALMSSENRAANALGRYYPGGLDAFVSAMNAKASLLGMHATRYVEPTGLSSQNQSNAQDLALLVRAAAEMPLMRELTTARETAVAVGRRQLQYRNSNALVRDPDWSIGLQKTGYISEAGRCVVMQAQMAGRNLIMVLLDSAGRYTRIADAERLRAWLTSGPLAALDASHPQVH